MRHSFLLLTVALAIIMLGCSGGGTPVTPDVTDQAQLPADKSAAMENHHIWGVYDITFNQPSGMFKFAPSKQSMMHVGVNDLAGGSPVGNFITIDFRGIDKQKRVLSFDLTLTNPFPNISARDVRGIISGDRPGYYLLNADGAVEIFNDTPTTFVAFAGDEPGRIFGGGASFTERCELHFPPDADFSKLRLVIDASYPGNCLEPYAFSEFSLDDDTIKVGVLDWQDDVESVSILASVLGADEDIALQYDEFDGTWYATLSEAPGGGYRLVNAEFIGKLAGDTNERLVDIITNFASTTHEINLPGTQAGLTDNIPNTSFPGTGTTSAPELGNTIKRLCFIKADSSGSSLYGLLRLEIEPLPMDLIAEIAGVLKMSATLQEQFYDPGLKDDEIDIVAFVANTPLGIYADIKNNADAAYPEIREIAEDIKSRYRSAQPELSKFRDEYYDEFKAGDSWAVAEYNAILDRHRAGKSFIGTMVRDLEVLKERRASYVTDMLGTNIAPLQEPAIFQLNGIEDTTIMQRDYVVNVLYIQTKVKRLGEIASLDTIEYIEPNFELELLLNIAHQAVNAPSMWGAGFTGGTFDVMVFDTGIDATHPALAAHLAPGQIRAFTGCDPDDSHGHGTHCAGIVSSMDLNYTGIAFGLDKLYNAKYCGGGWNNVVSAHNWAGMGGTVLDPAEITSFSWAWGPISGCIRDASYVPARYVDETTYLYGQLWSIAAGNSSTFICGDDNIITPPSDAYNSFCVANMNDFNTAPRANDRIAGSSRWGFGVAPGGEIRIKPDITAPGSSIMSCNNDWETEPDFVAKTGTSMAAPNVAGASALVMDAGLASSLEVRGMILNSAEDWNSNLSGPGSDGPDRYTGYGYLDLNNALLNLGNIVADNIAQGDYKFYRHSSPAANDSVMVIWDRYSVGLTALYPDIDIEMWDDATNIMIGSEDKTYDNRRFLITGTTNDVVYKIDANFIPAVSPTWDYVITATGGTFSTEMLPGSIDPILGYVEPMPVAVEVDITATITNTGDFTLRDVQGTLTLDTDMTFESGSVPTQTGAVILNPSQICIITWHVKLNAPSFTPKHVTVDTNAHAYGEIFTGYAEAFIDVVPPNPELFVNPTSLDFSFSTTVMPFSIQNIGGGTLNWTIDDSLFPGWLSVDKVGDSTQDEIDVVQVMVDRDGFTPTVYTHDIDVISDAGSDVVHISMVVPDPLIPIMNIQPPNLYFGEVVLQKNIIITNDGGGDLHWQIDHDPPKEFPGWLSVNIDAGIIDEMHPQGGCIVYCDRTGYAPGNYSYDMYFTSDGGNAVVHIYMSVHVPQPELYVNLDELDFGTDENAMEFIVQNVGEEGSTLNWSIPIIGIPSWLTLSKFSDSIGTDEISTVHVYVDRSGLTNPGGYSYQLQLSSNAGNATILAKLTLPDIDPLAPILVSPQDGHEYNVCTWLALSWDGDPGYDGKYWLDVKHNGVIFPPFSGLATPAHSISLPPILIDRMAKYGIWDWQVSIIETPVPMVKHYSDWWTIIKPRPELLTPNDNAVVNENTQFTWYKVPTPSPGNTVYVAKLKGFAPIDPFYFWWIDADSATLPPNWYQLLKDLGQSNTYTWTIAAVCQPQGGMTMNYAKAVKYPPAWTFHLE